jgi:hypothetical protein
MMLNTSTGSMTMLYLFHQQIRHYNSKQREDEMIVDKFRSEQNAICKQNDWDDPDWEKRGDFFHSFSYLRLK